MTMRTNQLNQATRNASVVEGQVSVQCQGNRQTKGGKEVVPSIEEVHW